MKIFANNGKNNDGYHTLVAGFAVNRSEVCWSGAAAFADDQIGGQAFGLNLASAVQELRDQ